MSVLKRLLCLSLMAFAAISWAADDEALPLDPKVTYGKLENGLTYYVRKNEKPENRMELYLVVNAGSILEDDDQQGLAHFLEHMAFNGTKHFEKLEIVNFLESIGMRFGADVNAYTSFDETVYTLQLPTDDLEKVEKGFQILEDWAHNITIEAEEIEKERGVVVEEWRSRRGAGSRIFDKQLPLLAYGSRYADRLPIGQTEVLKTAQREAFTRFYDTWYRPNLMAVIAVGDFDEADVVARIKKHFAPLENPKEVVARPEFDIPDHEETLFSAERDPELQQTQIQILYKHPAEKSKTASDFRRDLVQGLYTNMLNQRLNELSQKAEPPFLYAYSARGGSFSRNKDAFFQMAVVPDGKVLDGLTAMFTEARRAQQHGFTTGEFERAKVELLRGYERRYDERDKTESNRFARGYVNHFLEGNARPGIEKSLAMVKEYLPGISLDEVNKAGEGWITEKNRVILLSGPEKEGAELPGKETVLKLIHEIESKDIAAYEDDVVDAPLIAEEPQAGTITEEKRLEKIDTYEFKLSNGVRVIAKSTEFKDDEVLFSAHSEGGTSKLPDDLYSVTEAASWIVSQSGLGPFDNVQLQKKLAGKIAGAGPYIGSYGEGMSGRASTKDLETLMQLIYLNFTAPRLDENAVGMVKTQLKTFVANQDKDPNSVFRNAFNKRKYNDHPRMRPWTVESIERQDAKASFELYKERFADASDFTFVFVGKFEMETFKDLAKRYLASLPVVDREDSWQDLNIDPISGKHDVVVHKGREPKSTVRMNFYGDTEWSPEKDYAMDSLVAALRIRLREILREDMGGVYGVGVSGNLSIEPKQEFEANVFFGCSPDNVDSLVKAVYDEIERVKKEGVPDEVLTKVRETQRRTYEVSLEQNRFWMNSLMAAYRYERDPAKILEFEKRVETLDNDMIKEAAGKFFSLENHILGVLHPEKDVLAEGEN